VREIRQQIKLQELVSNIHGSDEGRDLRLGGMYWVNTNTGRIEEVQGCAVNKAVC
jgi:hypothetical protein